MEIIGHIIGFIATATFFYSYQIFDKKKLLLVQTVATGMMCVQYLLIGASSGFVLNLVGVGRNLLFYHRDKKVLSGMWLPILLAFVMGGMGLLSWEGYHSLLVIVGLAVNAFCLGVCDSQQLRISLLFTCPLVLLYNIFVLSYGGILNETLSLISAILGIVRYKKNCSE